MGELTQALYDVLASDPVIVGLVGAYHGEPAVFTTYPVPDDAPDARIVTAGAVAVVPFDTKTSRGWDITRDVRCYTAADGSSETVELMALRVVDLLHRQALAVAGWGWELSNVVGPIAADERDAYGRIVTVTVRITRPEVLVVTEYGSYWADIMATF